MKQILLIASLLYSLIPRKKSVSVEVQTLPESVSTKVQTDYFRYPVRIRNKAIRPKCWAKKERKHGDWFLRKFCLKNKIIIYNNSEYEIEARITPRNIMSAVSIKGAGGNFNTEYDEEVYVIAPKSRFRIRNYPTLSYYMQLFINSSKISNKLYFCNDDIVISTEKNVQNTTNRPCQN